jgi:hypothetical protein
MIKVKTTRLKLKMKVSPEKQRVRIVARYTIA